MEPFTIADLARLAGMTYAPARTLILGLGLSPSGRSRNADTFHPKTALAFLAVWELIRRGIRGEALTKTIRFILRASLRHRLSRGERFLYVAGDQVFFGRAGATFTPTPPALVTLDLVPLIEKVGGVSAVQFIEPKKRPREIGSAALAPSGK